MAPAKRAVRVDATSTVTTNCAAATPCKTIGAAIAMINGGAPQQWIKVVAGSYAEASLAPTVSMNITGTGVDFQSTSMNVPAVTIASGTNILLQGLALHATGGSSTADGVKCTGDREHLGGAGSRLGRHHGGVELGDRRRAVRVHGDLAAHQRPAQRRWWRRRQRGHPDDLAIDDLGQRRRRE